MATKRRTTDTPAPPTPRTDAEISPRFATVGRRKSAIARVRLTPGEGGTFVVNGRTFDTYFPTLATRVVGYSALDAVGQRDTVSIEAKIVGGGLHAQAEALRLGIARALFLLNPALRPILKKAGYLTRDARVKERKKPGLKRARKAPQWAKR